MSLIRARRSRKKSWIDTRRGPGSGRLLVLLVFVVALLWYLNRF